MTNTLRLATRGSPLARRQTDSVADALQAAHRGLEVEVVVVRTRGDELSAPLDQIGGQGVFVTEVEAAVAEGRADAAVHSAKDMTSIMVDGLMLAAVPGRADPRDGLVGCRLADLPPGGVIATGSARRRAQLANLRPDLSFTEIRGNMERRVSRGEDGSVTAVVVAVAALERLGWLARLSDILDPVDVLPQAGQGAIAVQCRADDGATLERLSAVDDVASHWAVRAERSVLAGLGGNCSVPVGAWAETEPGLAADAPARLGGQCRWTNRDPIVAARDRSRSPGRRGGPWPSWSITGDGASTALRPPRAPGRCGRADRDRLPGGGRAG